MVGRSLTRWEFSYVSPAKRPSREHEKRAEPPEGAIPLEEYCERERISLRKAMYLIYQGKVESVLAPAGQGNKRRLRRFILQANTVALINIPIV